MIDPTVAQALVKQLSRWFRQRRKPHGTVDHFYRGTRMSFSATYRNVTCFTCFIALAVACALYFIPGITEGKSPLVVALLKIGWGLVVAVAILLPMRAFREGVVVTDDGLIKCDLFGRETRMTWKEIHTYRIKADENKVTLISTAKAKFVVSLAYDGWQDFLEMAAKHLHPTLYWQLMPALQNMDIKPAISRSTKKKARKSSVR